MSAIKLFALEIPLKNMKVLPSSSGAKGPQTSTVTEEVSELFSAISVILLSLIWKKVTNIDNK